MFENITKTTFEGGEWVNVSVEWHRLPRCIQASSDRWLKRFAMLKIPLALVRFTEVDNIVAKLDVAPGGVKRTPWVLEDDWRRHVNTAYVRKVRLGHATVSDCTPQSSNDVSNDASTSATTDTGTNTSTGHPGNTILDLDPIMLTHAEKFTHNGQVLRMNMYGERTPDGLFTNITDILHAIGVRSDNIPTFVVIQRARVNGEEIRVVSFEMLITLICSTANAYEIAAALRRWITAVVVATQFGGEAPVTQAVFATRSSKGYASKFYGFPNSQEKYACLYMLEACSGRLASELYPEQISAVLPEGRNIDEFCVVKRGSSIDGRTRTSDNRTALKRIFPGSDPLPVHTSGFPEISEADILDMETSVFVDEFEHRRIAGIRYRDSECKELYLFDHLDIHAARLSMDGHARQYVKQTITSAKDEAAVARSDADQKDRACDIIRERLACRERELERSDHDLIESRQRCAALEKDVHASREMARAELSHTRKAALSTMPAESAKIAAVFWGVGDI
jgi:hypothetical protein